MAKDKKGFQLYTDQRDIIKDCTIEEKGIVLDWIFDYVNDENPELPSDRFLKNVIEQFKKTFKRDLKKWEATCEKNARNGAKGGRPKGSRGKNPINPAVNLGKNKNPTKPKKADTDTDTDIDIDKEDNTKRKPVKKALPMPTLEEFILHAKERKANVNPEDVRLKYFSWKDNDWCITRDNKTRPILNWKSTLTNTVKFLGVVAITEKISNLADPLTLQQENEERLAKKKASM